MKPTIRSTAILYLALGVAALLLGLSGLPRLAALPGGLAAVATGVGLYLRLRPAWTLGLAYALCLLAASAFRLWRALAGGDGGGAGATVGAAVWLAAALYLLFSLAVIRPRYRRAASWRDLV